MKATGIVRRIIGDTSCGEAAQKTSEVTFTSLVAYKSHTSFLGRLNHFPLVKSGIA